MKAGVAMLIAPFACRCSPPVPVLSIWSLTVMPLLAFSVSEFALFHETGAATVMLPPFGATFSDAVSTVTLLVTSAATRSPLFSTEVPVVESENGVVVLIVAEDGVLLIVMSVGSSSSVPVLPCAAEVLTVPANASVPLLDVSTKPPSPPKAPPLAEMLPAKRVWPSAQTATLPPLPLLTASALMMALWSTKVLEAFCSSPAPWKLPPIRAVPPPTAPDTFTLAPANKPTLSPSTLTVPPTLPASKPAADNVPSIATTPRSPPSMNIWPLRLAIALARTMPLVLITVSSTALAECAVMKTLPPSALMLPEFVTAALAVAASTLRLTSLSPAMSRLTRPPAASATLSALMLPALTTCGALSTT